MASFASGELSSQPKEEEVRAEDDIPIDIKSLTLASLKIEVERALAEDDETMATTLKGQIEKLETELRLSEQNNNNDQDDGSNDCEHCNGVIKDSLYIGDLTAAVDPGIVSRNGFTHIVDLANTICDHHHLHGNERNVHYEIPRETGDWRDTCPTIVSKLVVRVDDVDNAPLDEHFDAMNAYIKNARSEGGVVLVHCFRGKSRSATTVIQYLMQEEGMTLRDGLDSVKTARPMIQLNTGFRKQLMALESRLRPGEEPSIVLKLGSRKPQLSSMKRRPSGASIDSST
mmetsp:Transcript_14559/g.18887  ORF Transcript_14559/g.18887 Transcript_14559/m.18887 type:complete len:286 (-) Transcript_14559:310-1167(-)